MTGIVNMLAAEAAGAEPVAVNTALYKCKLYISFRHTHIWETFANLEVTYGRKTPSLSLEACAQCVK